VAASILLTAHRRLPEQKPDSPTRLEQTFASPFLAQHRHHFHLRLCFCADPGASAIEPHAPSSRQAAGAQADNAARRRQQERRASRSRARRCLPLARGGSEAWPAPGGCPRLPASPVSRGAGADRPFQQPTVHPRGSSSTCGRAGVVLAGQASTPRAKRLVRPARPALARHPAPLCPDEPPGSTTVSAACSKNMVGARHPQIGTI
jgi:hypothetical protein